MQDSKAGTRWTSALKGEYSAVLFALLTIAVVFGGGGVRYGMMNAVVQISALAILAFRFSRMATFWRGAPTPLRILVALTLLVPLLQLMPLPPQIWHALPGRMLANQSLSLLGQSDHWRPLTLDPARTLVAFFSLLAPFAILVMLHGQSPALRTAVIRWVAGLGLLNILFGAIQLASGQRLMSWYGGSNPFHLYGTFANHNSAALFLVVALCALLGIGTSAHPAQRMVKAALSLLFACGILLTQSRSGIALLIVPAIQLLVQHLRTSRRLLSRRSSYGAPIALLAATGFLSALAVNNPKAGEILHRFDDLQDARPMIWQDTAVAISRYWPVGSGIGTFDEVFQIDESLENVNSHMAGRAHNEYLEILLESGVIGGALIVAWGIYIFLLAAPRSRGDYSGNCVSISALLAIAMQSFLDYPLRNQAIMCVAAAMIALLANESERTLHR